MDLEFWVYILIGVIAFLSRLLKKPESPQSPTHPTREEPSQHPTGQPRTGLPRQMTFEELLQEITERKQSQSTYEREPEIIDYDDKIEEETKSLEEVGYSFDKTYADYKGYEYEEAVSPYGRVSLEETAHIGEPVEFGKFKVFEQQQEETVLDEYIREFQDPEGMKKAVVMSEILKTKF